jgi:hypothetical protein
MATTDTARHYTTLEEVQQRKQELRRQLDRDSQEIEKLWSNVFVKREESTKGEFIASVISNSALAIDAFLMVRKIKKYHSGLLRFFSKKKSK